MSLQNQPESNSEEFGFELMLTLVQCADQGKLHLTQIWRLFPILFDKRFGIDIPWNKITQFYRANRSSRPYLVMYIVNIGDIIQLANENVTGVSLFIIFLMGRQFCNYIDGSKSTYSFS